MIDITAVFYYYFIASKEFAFGLRRIFSAPPASNALPICKLLPAAFSLPGRKISRRKRGHSPFRCDGRSEQPSVRRRIFSAPPASNALEQPSVRRRIFSAPPASNALPICKLLPAAFSLPGRKISRRKRGHSPSSRSARIRCRAPRCGGRLACRAVTPLRVVKMRRRSLRSSFLGNYRAAHSFSLRVVRALPAFSGIGGHTICT